MTLEDPGIPLSPRLRRVAQRLAAEEVAAVYCHELTGELGAARMLVHSLRRRVSSPPDAGEADPRAVELADMLDEALRSALALTRRSLPPEAKDLHDPSDLAAIALATFAEAQLERLRLEAPSPIWVDADEGEIAVALVALVENALEGSAGPVIVRCLGAEGRAQIEVIDEGAGVAELDQSAPPFTSKKPGRLGLGLHVARRVARRWNGSLEICRVEGRTVARIGWPLIRGAGSVDG